MDAGPADTPVTYPVVGSTDATEELELEKTPGPPDELSIFV